MIYFTIHAIYYIHVVLYYYSFYRNKDELTEERLSAARVLVLPGPREKFTAAEVCSYIASTKSHLSLVEKILDAHLIMAHLGKGSDPF